MISKKIFAREFGLKGHSAAPFCLDFMSEFKCHRQDEFLIEGLEISDIVPPLACSFSKERPEHLAIVDEEGGVVIINTQLSRNTAMRNAWMAHSNAIFDVDWAWSVNELATGSGDATVVVWDVESEKRVCLFKGHGSSVKTISYMPQQNDVLVSGARDGCVMFWDRRVNTRGSHSLPTSVVCNAHDVGSTRSAHVHPVKKKKRSTNGTTATSTSRRYCDTDSTGHSVTSVVFQDEYNLLSAGNADGCVKVWDPRKIYSTTSTKTCPLTKHMFTAPQSNARSYGISCISLDGTRTRLFANCRDNVLYQFDLATWKTEPVMRYGGHEVKTFYVKQSVSPDDRFIVSGSSCGSAYIWPIPQSLPTRLREPLGASVELKGHICEVASVAWCPVDLRRIVTVSDDNAVWVWRMDPGVRENYENYELGGGTIVGTSQLLVTSSEAEKTKVPLTPRKGATVPPSPAKLSPAVRQTISSLQRRTPTSVTPYTPKSLGPYPPSKLLSPTITTFFSRSSKSERTKSCVVPSPRKLIITPKKSASAAGASEAMGASEALGGGGLKSPMRGEAVRAGGSGGGENMRGPGRGESLTPSLSGAKRKLCVDLSSDIESTKRARLVERDGAGSVRLVERVDTGSDNFCSRLVNGVTADEVKHSTVCQSNVATSDRSQAFTSQCKNDNKTQVYHSPDVTGEIKNSNKISDSSSCFGASNVSRLTSEFQEQKPSTSMSSVVITRELPRPVLIEICLNPEDGSLEKSPSKESSPLKRSPHATSEKLKFESTSTSRFRDNLAFSSPTANLPNSVFDAPLSSPLRERLEDKVKPKTPDWLTQLRLAKQNSAEKTKPNTSPATARRVKKLYN